MTDAKIPGNITKTQQRQRPAQLIGLPIGWADTADARGRKRPVQLIGLPIGGVDTATPKADLQEADLLGGRDGAKGGDGTVSWRRDGVDERYNSNRNTDPELQKLGPSCP